MNVFQKFRKYGIKGGLHFFATHILHTEIIKAHYMRMDIAIDEIDAKLVGFCLPVKELVYDDFFKGDKNFFKGSKLELYKQRCLDPTYKAYGIIENDRLVYSTWISFFRMGMAIETKPFYLNDDEGYLEDSYCDPIARGRGLHGKMNDFRIKKIYENGKKKVVAIVQENNMPAFKVQFRSGLEEIGTFRYGIIFGIKFNTYYKGKFDVQ